MGENVESTSFIWKGAKKRTGNIIEQETIRLVDATKEQLIEFKNHCIVMLTNVDKTHPGRNVLMEIIKDQMNRCGVELFLRSQEAAGVSRFAIINSIKTSKSDNGISDDDFKKMSLSNLVNVDSEYYDLPIELVLDGCLDKLARFDRSHITLTFLLKQGIWFTKEESEIVTNAIKEQRERGFDTGREEVVREMLKLPDTAKISFTPSGLSLASMRSMLTLKSRKYSELSTDQLKLLRERVLFAHQDDVAFHIKQWKERLNQIDEIAKLKGFDI